jgi:hypothetical protein
MSQQSEEMGRCKYSTRARGEAWHPLGPHIEEGSCINWQPLAAPVTHHANCTGPCCCPQLYQPGGPKYSGSPAPVTGEPETPEKPSLQRWLDKRCNVLRPAKPDAPDVESGRPMSAEQDQPGRHKWDRDGERCELCGDKDWMGGPCNGRSAPPTEQPQDPLPPLDNATVEDLSNAWNGEVAKRTKPWSQKALTLAFAIRERQLRASLAENTRLREALAEHRLAFGYTTYNGNTMEDCLKMAREEIAALAKREVSK